MRAKLERMERRNYCNVVTHINTAVVVKLLGVNEYRRFRRYNLTQYQENHVNNEID